MLSFSGSLKVFLALDPIDMRKGFEGLYAAVSEKLQADVKSGALFVFTNNKRTRLKVLYFDGNSDIEAVKTQLLMVL
jgi:transposase